MAKELAPWDSPSGGSKSEKAPWDVSEEDVTPELPEGRRSLRKQASDLLKDVGGVGTAAVDLIGQAPAFLGGMVGAGEQAIGSAMKGQMPPFAEMSENVGRSASEHNMADMLPEGSMAFRGNPGYKATMLPLDRTLQGVRQGYGNIAGVLGASPETAENVGAGAELALLGAGMKGTGGKPAPYEPRTPSLKGQEAIRETYKPKVPEKAPWEDYDYMPSDLLGNVDNPEQMVQGEQFRQDPAEVARRQAEYDADRSQEAREYQASQGQPDLFQGTQEDLQNRTSGGTGMRDTIPGPNLENYGVREKPGFDDPLSEGKFRGEFDPTLTTSEYTGPRQRGEPPDNSIEYRKYDSERIADQVAASEVPGFQRSAEQVIRARELEKAENQPQARAVEREDLAGNPVKISVKKIGDRILLLDERGNLTDVTEMVKSGKFTLEQAIEHYFPEKRGNLRDRSTKPESPSKEGNPEARLPAENLREFWDWELFRKLQRGDGSKKNVVRTGLEHVRDNSQSPYYRQLATKLLEDEGFKPDFEVKPEYENARTAGRYLSSEHKVTMHGDWLGSEQLLLHEALHARVYAAIQAYKSWKASGGAFKAWDRQFKHVQRPVMRIAELYDSLKGKELEQIKDKYGLSDIHEFVAEGFSNPAFQAELAQLKLPRELTKGNLFTYYWDAFVGAVTKLLGFKGKANTYLAELIRSGSDLMSNMTGTERIYYADMIDFHKDLGARIEDIVGNMRDAAREFRLDKFGKLSEEIIPQLKAKDAKIEDFTAKDSNLLWQSAMRIGSMIKKNLLQDTTIGQLMKDKPGTGPVLRWTIDQVSRIEREGIIKTKQALDTALKPFRKMYHDKALRADLIDAWKTWQQNIGVRDLTKADFRTDRQWDMYKNFQGVFDTILDELNEKRIAAGFKPIERIQSYFHAAWEGDYRVFAYDGAGAKKWAQGFKTEWEAKKMASAYRKAHPELKIDDPTHVIRDKYGLNDLSAFEDAIRVMGKDDPVTQALQKTYHEILQKRGFGRTGVHRKGVLGYLGMEEGALGLRMMERSFDQYVNQAYRYMGNLEKQKVLAELQKIPTEIRKEKLPETFDFLYSYIRKTQGAQLDKVAIDGFVTGLTQAVGLGQGAPLRFIRGGAQLASLYWLTTPRFLISQAVQSVNAIPKLIQQFGTVDGTKAFFDGWLHTLRPDDLTREGAEWASKKGYLDPTIKNMVTGDPYSVPIGASHPVFNMQAIKEVGSFPAAVIEHHLVRLPTFIMFEKALRPFIKDKEQRFQEAAEKTDYYMVNYARAHGPLVYDKLGLTGEAARPLKQYSHNTWGQFIEYSKGLKDRGEVAPLAAFFGVQAAVAGMKGMILVAEATVIINTLNAMFNMDIPTPEQLMLKSSLHDALVYGGLSTILGHDVSSSTSAPSLPQMFSFPPIQFGAKAIVDVGNFAVKFIQGEDTDYHRLRAAMALTPNLMHEWLRTLYTNPGDPTVNPNDKQLRGNYRRTDNENIAAIIFGAKPLNEAKVDALMRGVKQELQRDMAQRMSALDAMADRVMKGGEVTPELLQSYVREGGDLSRLPKTLINRMKEKMLTGPERIEQNKTITPSTMHKLDIEREYLDRITNDMPNKAMGFNPETGKLEPIGYRSEQPRGAGDKPVYSDSEPPASWLPKVMDRLQPSETPSMDKSLHRPFKDQENDVEYMKKTGRGQITPEQFRKRQNRRIQM